MSYWTTLVTESLRVLLLLTYKERPQRLGIFETFDQTDLLKICSLAIICYSIIGPASSIIFKRLKSGGVNSGYNLQPTANVYGVFVTIGVKYVHHIGV